MKTSLLHRIACMLLALFILISSTGMSLNIHYCGNELYNYSLIGQVDSCQSDSDIKDDHSSKIKNTGCCSFDHFKIDTSDSYKFSDFDKESNVNFDLTFTKIFTKTLVENSILIVNNRIHPPPAKIKTNDIYLKIESFLI